MGHSFQILPNILNRGTHAWERFFLEVRQRYRWILTGGGERVLLYQRRFEGERCPLFDQVRKSGQQHGQDDICFGTGFVGGYFKPIEIVVSLLAGGEEKAVIEEYGRRRIYTPHSWTLWEPILHNGDFIVRRNNQRLWITSTYPRRWKRFITRQDFDLVDIEKNHPIYSIPT